MPAFKCKPAAVMSWSASFSLLLAPTRSSASRMLPSVAVMLTWPSANSMSPTVTSVKANRRAVAAAPVLRNTLVALCLMLPVSATTSMLPPVVRMSAAPVKSMLLAASTLMLPLPLKMSALAVTSVPTPSVCTNTLPAPKALMAASSAGLLAVPGAVPLLRVIPPLVVRSTIWPSPPVVRMSLWTASLTSALPAAPVLVTRFTLKPTSSTISASASNR